MHAFAQQRGLRAKTDQLDAVTIARALLSGEARFGYVPSEQVATYRELMRLQKQREPMTWCATKMRFMRCWLCCSPNSRRFLPIPRGPPPWRSSSAIEAAQAIAQTEVETLSTFLHELAPRRPAITGGQPHKSWCGWPKRRSAVGWPSLPVAGPGSQGHRHAGRPGIWPDDGGGAAGRIGGSHALHAHRPGGRLRWAGSGPVKQSGKWKGQTKLSKHGSGRVRRILYLAALRSIHLETSPFGASYQRLVGRSMKKGMAVVAVMRNMLIVAVHLIQTEESYDAGKVARQAGS